MTPVIDLNEICNKRYGYKNGLSDLIMDFEVCVDDLSSSALEVARQLCTDVPIFINQSWLICDGDRIEGWRVMAKSGYEVILSFNGELYEAVNSIGEKYITDLPDFVDLKTVDKTVQKIQEMDELIEIMNSKSFCGRLKEHSFGAGPINSIWPILVTILIFTAIIGIPILYLYFRYAAY